ncbi:MAG TPA: helix-turn-helix transcriptional regulator [Verrucomicrobiae bacterium]|nr:helix-turn-helix transcriptional regulator [Verrucomicrobiae bacterium]
MQKRYFTELATPREVAAEIGARARQLRLAKGLRQAELAKRARVSPATVGRFEATGEATFAAVLRIATALGVERGLIELFSPAPRSIAELEATDKQIRKRARRVMIRGEARE